MAAWHEEHVLCPWNVDLSSVFCSVDHSCVPWSVDLSRVAAQCRLTVRLQGLCSLERGLMHSNMHSKMSFKMHSKILLTCLLRCILKCLLGCILRCILRCVSERTENTALRCALRGAPILSGLDPCSHELGVEASATWSKGTAS
eukprot:366296-Chlamydomonas_euryale.AAC.15